MDSISDQSTRAPTPNFFDSRWPTRATTHERLGTFLMITATPERRTVQFKTTSPNGSLPHGLSNAADQVSRHTQSLFRKMDLSSRQPMHPARHFVNMVSVRTLPEDNTASTNSSTGSVPTEVLRHEDEVHDLDLLPYPPAASRFFHLDEEIWFSISATTNQSSTKKMMSKGSSASSAMLIVLNDEQMKNCGSWSQITLTTLSTWWGTSKCSRHQALTWLSPWQTSTDSQTPQNTRVFGLTYGHT